MYDFLHSQHRANISHKTFIENMQLCKIYHSKDLIAGLYQQWQIDKLKKTSSIMRENPIKKFWSPGLVILFSDNVLFYVLTLLINLQGNASKFFLTF